MSDSAPPPRLLFGKLAKRPVTALFDRTQGSGDGGAILLEASSRRFGNGFIEGLTSCFHGRRQANKYVPMQEIRLAAALTSLARAQAWTIRERLLKLGARVVSPARRLVIRLPQAFPWKAEFQKAVLALGATAGQAGTPPA